MRLILSASLIFIGAFIGLGLIFFGLLLHEAIHIFIMHKTAQALCYDFGSGNLMHVSHIYFNISEYDSSQFYSEKISLISQYYLHWVLGCVIGMMGAFTLIAYKKSHNHKE